LAGRPACLVGLCVGRQAKPLFISIIDPDFKDNPAPVLVIISLARPAIFNRQSQAFQFINEVVQLPYADFKPGGKYWRISGPFLADELINSFQSRNIFQT